MNTLGEAAALRDMVAALGLEVLALTAVAVCLQRALRSGLWHRALWQGCVVGILALAALELTGIRQQATAWASRARTDARAVSHASAPAAPLTTVPAPGELPEHRAPAPDSSGDLGAREVRPPAVSFPAPRALDAAPGTPSAIRGGNPSAPPSASAASSVHGLALGIHVWFARTWLLGCLFLLLWGGLGHLRFRRTRRRATGLRVPALRRLVETLSRQLGFGRSVEVVESPRFGGPVAFGILRRTIGLPPGFAQEHPTKRQEVMLIHELAHLAARDPAWQLLADLMAALLWWHPAVWWARRRLQFASEIAADEASLLISDGPCSLAECLVERGIRLARGTGAGRLGVGTAFRSGLARRVQRLSDMHERVWCPPRPQALFLVKSVGLGLGLPVMLFLMIQAFPASSTKGEPMKPWKRPIQILALATLAGAQTAPAAAANPAAVPAPATPASVRGLGGGGGGGVAAAELPGAAKGGGGAGGATAGPRGARNADDLGTPPTAGSAAVAAANAPFGGATAGFGVREGDGAQALRRKLEQIVLDEVQYDNLPLSSVVEQLIEESRRRDPQKRGVNFLFALATSVPSVDASTGLPVVSPHGDSRADQATIRIMPALRKVRLLDVLDAITRVADSPVSYTVQDYAVVFSRDPAVPGPAAGPAPSGPAPPQAPAPAPRRITSRAFKLDTNVFFASFEKTFGSSVANSSSAVVDGLRGTAFPKVGLDLDGPGRTILYNEVTGMLLVRGTADELEAVRATVELLGGKSNPNEPPTDPHPR